MFCLAPIITLFPKVLPRAAIRRKQEMEKLKMTPKVTTTTMSAVEATEENEASLKGIDFLP